MKLIKYASYKRKIETMCNMAVKDVAKCIYSHIQYCAFLFFYKAILR